MDSVKAVLKDLLPPLLVRKLSSLRPKPVEIDAVVYGASGQYGSFAEAAAAAGIGYHDAIIREKTKELTRAILPQKLVSQLDARLLSALQYTALRTDLDVLDFGGAMGAHYFYLRHLLPPVKKWTVVELEETSKLAQTTFADGILRSK